MNHITRVRPVPWACDPLQQTPERRESAWDVAISERLQLLLDQRVGEELRGVRKGAAAVQGYGGVLTELCDLDRVILLFCLQLKLDLAAVPEEEKIDPSVGSTSALTHFGTGLALLPFVMQGVDWTDPLQVTRLSDCES